MIKSTSLPVVKQPSLTKEQKMHNFISDVLMITNDNALDKKKTFLYEYMGKQFELADLDTILMNRL